MSKQIIGFVGQMGVENPSLLAQAKKMQYQSGAGKQPNIHYTGEMGSSYYTSSTIKKGVGCMYWNKPVSILKPSDREKNKALIKKYGGIRVDNKTITQKYLDELNSENESIVYLSVRYGFGNTGEDYEGLYILKNLSDLQSSDRNIEYYIISNEVLQNNAVFQ